MNRETELAFEAARDTSKTILTLTTAIIVVTATFYKSSTQQVETIAKWFVLGGTLLFMLSTIGGISTLMALTGKLGASSEGEAPITIWATVVAWPARLQIITFGLGLICTVFAIFFLLL